jgi:hypothetical protein
MNLGPAVEYDLSSFNITNRDPELDSPPSNLNLGVYAEPAANDFFSFGIQLAFSKLFDRKAGEEAASSFKTLFTDWSQFPNDAILSTGLAFNWKPLRLGENVYFWQELYLGNKSSGSKAGINNFYSHGGLIGVEYSGIKFTAGYAGYWHNVGYKNYISLDFPYEMFQFTLRLSEDYLFMNKSQEGSSDKFLDRIVLSSGTGYTYRVGKFSEPHPWYKYENGMSYYFEAGFYFSKNCALISTLIYNPINVKYSTIDLDFTTIETFTLASSIRYFPYEEIEFLFFQTGIGIYRLNPIVKSTPRYDYKAAIITAIGSELEIYNGFYIIPTINWFLTFDRTSGSAPRMQGWNQFDYVLKFGYSFR